MSITVQLCEFANDNSDNRATFERFLSATYLDVSPDLRDPNISFLVLMENRKDVIGLLAMVPYDEGRKVHILFIAIAERWRRKGLGTKMLVHMAQKFPNKEITLNVAFESMHLLDFYCKTGYARQKQIDLKIGAIVLSLIHVNLLSKLELPDEHV